MLERITPSWWRPSEGLRAAVADYRRIAAELKDFDGDRRGHWATAMVAAQSRIVAAIHLNPDGGEDNDDDFEIVRACADLIAREVDAIDRRAGEDPLPLTIVDALVVLVAQPTRYGALFERARSILTRHLRTIDAGRPDPQPTRYGSRE